VTEAKLAPGRISVAAFGAQPGVGTGVHGLKAVAIDTLDPSGLLHFLSRTRWGMGARLVAVGPGGAGVGGTLGERGIRILLPELPVAFCFPWLRKMD
jgi:hypothetical protein